MKSILKIALLALLFPAVLPAQEFIRMDTLQSYPRQIDDLVKGSVKHVLGIDITGDGEKDYVVELDQDQESGIDYCRYWLRSDFSILRKEVCFGPSIDYVRFVNLDSDPEPEIYSATGFEDGIDYAIYDQDLKTGKQKLLFYFFPVLAHDGNDYWGYPWDVEGILQRTENGEVRLFVSLDHDISDDGEITFTDDQRLYPVVFFSGDSSSFELKGDRISDRKWMTLKEIQAALKPN